ncbi:DUF4336 domain-containing protein [Thermocoleostomius sinensis]|uniref:DUF4336 domain-containing protein n=1 Tax=Thermocoleostomius sinensis A174 TaxID=2016057 RepID=A0A9E8ZAT2_9CYAN|nr:DUF4336 domain-containing protein [Thermocoleostomius sinensis A174]
MSLPSHRLDRLPEPSIASAQPQDWRWKFWMALPLYPYGCRRTLRTEVVKDTIWTFDQLHGILYTIVPIRMTVVRLQTGGLLVYAPVAPTIECIRLINQLVAQHGEVKYILLPTSSGLEHKVFVGPFARCFPQAQVFVAPHQWSFPLNLPLSWLGFPQRRTQELPTGCRHTPFADEFDYAVLDIDLGRGAFVEVALLHKPSQTLLVTDAVLSVPINPPAIVQLDPYPLLFHARDGAGEAVTDTDANRRKGWQRISLFAIYFRPSVVETVGLGQAIRDALKAPDRSQKAYFGLYPFRWKENWPDSFKALHRDGRLFVAPILQTLIFPQAPQQVLNWVETIANWSFQRIIPCHFDAPIAANSNHFRQAFACLQTDTKAVSLTSSTLSDADAEFIRNLEAALVRRGIAKPPKTRG